MEHFGTMVKQARVELNISKGELSAAAGVGLTTIYRIEQGDKTLQNATVCKICDALGLDIPSEEISIVRIERIKRGLTLGQAAQKIGISTTSLRRFETCGGRCSEKTIEKINKFFGVESKGALDEQRA